MLDLNPEFRIYGPPTFMYGGVEITPPYRSSDLNKEMLRVLKDIGDSVRQAYGIYTIINTQLNNLISTRISPLTASINEKCKDYQIRGEKLAKILSQRLTIQGKDTGLFTHEKGFYVVHKLKEKFDPKTTEFLLKAVKAAILTFTYNKFRISSIVSDNLLRVDAEIIPTDTLYVV